MVIFCFMCAVPEGPDRYVGGGRHWSSRNWEIYSDVTVISQHSRGRPEVVHKILCNGTKHTIAQRIILRGQMPPDPQMTPPPLK